MQLDLSAFYTLDELVHYVNDLNNIGGGTLEILGKNNEEDITIIIDQNEWYDSAVCMIGGNGNPVKTIGTEKVLQELPKVLDYYFDKDTSFTVSRIK